MGFSPTSRDAFASLPAFELRPSRTVVVGILLLHTAAAAPALLLASLGPAWRLIWLAAVLLELVLTLRRHLPGLRTAPARLGRDASGTWWLEDGAGRCWQGVPGDAIVHPWLCVLRVGQGWRARTVVVAADACSAAQHRRLRAALRDHRGESPRVA